MAGSFGNYGPFARAWTSCKMPVPMNDENSDRQSFDDGEEFVRDVVRAAFPEGGGATTEAFASIYEGSSFAPDYRDNTYPRDEKGNPLFTGPSHEEYLSYVEWLADHLPQIDLPPSPKQAALCQTVTTMAPNDAMFYLGMNAALRENGWGLDWRSPEAVSESEEERRQWTDVEATAEAGYRIPMGIILRPIENHDERVELVRTFFKLYLEYSRK